MITSKMVVEALKTSHEACEKTDGCIHADAFSGASKELEEFIVLTGLGAIEHPTCALEFVIYTAIHVGYRLRQLEEQADAKQLVN